MEGDLFKDPQNVFERQLRDVFKVSPTSNKDPLGLILSLVIHHNPNTSDITDVYKLLGVENFVRLIHLLDGRTIRLPTSSELRDALLTAICYYYREIEHLDWPEIKERIPFEFHAISMSRKIKNLNMAFYAELNNMFNIGQVMSPEKEKTNEPEQ